jgi:putative hydrolase of the HAD superfamily
MDPIRAVLFDLDNTLVMEDAATLAAVRSACAVAASRARVSADALFARVPSIAEMLWQGSNAFAYAERMGIGWGEGLWGEFRGEARELRALRDFVPDFRTAVWTDALAEMGVSDKTLAAELGNAYRTTRRSRQLVDPDAEPVLGALAREHRLALVTNGAPDIQREKLAGTTLARYFGAIVISCEVEVAKPDRRIFEIALDRIGADAQGAVMVGDSLARDVAGARAAGIRVIWIDRQLSPDEKGPEPDARIESLSELPAALAALAPPAASPRGSRVSRPGSARGSSRPRASRTKGR